MHRVIPDWEIDLRLWFLRVWVLKSCQSHQAIRHSPGICVGPILFLLSINDLAEDIQSQVRLFADDTAVFLTLDKQNI